MFKIFKKIFKFYLKFIIQNKLKLIFILKPKKLKSYKIIHFYY